jgi:ankyrin repeat protein
VKFCKAVRAHDLASVMDQLARDPQLLNATAKAPPKKDDGQSPLQIALKTGAFDVADHLIDQGADIHFMEQESVNEWKAPVLHDALRGCLFDPEPSRPRQTLRKMLSLGADANCRDSYGNSALDRVMLDARIVFQEPSQRERAPVIFADLLEFGADRFAGCMTREPVDCWSRGEESYRLLVQALGGSDDWRGAVWRDEIVASEYSGATDADERTPLITAAIFGSMRSLEDLLSRGAGPNTADAAGWSALGLAWWSVPVSKILLEHGGDPNQRLGDSGYTPFSRTFHRPELAELMLSHGADADTRRPDGKTYADVRSSPAR